MANLETATDRPWPRVKWDLSDLQKVAEVLQIVNPLGFDDADSLASYIRSLSEKELYRYNGPMDISTGGWCVSFFRAWDHVADNYDFCAIVTLSSYTIHKYIKSNQK